MIVLGEGAVCWGSVQRLLGPLAVVLGDRQSAITHFEESAGVHARLGALPFLAYDRLGLAALLAGGTAEERVTSKSLARTGLTLARRFGQHALLGRHRDLAAAV